MEPAFYQAPAKRSDRKFMAPNASAGASSP